MFSDKQLLHILTKQGFHSGTDLGLHLGVSRAAIQKRIANLRARGLPVSRVPGKGYSLDEKVRLLDQDAILSLMTVENRKLISSFNLLQSVPSTSEYLAGISTNPGQVAVSITESQLEGRGRRGRTWVSTPYRNLMYSMSWCFSTWPAAITGLSLAAGMEVARVLRGLGIDDVMVKWPNDLVADKQKLGGILIDVRGEANSNCRVIMGLGLNISLSGIDTSNIEQPWTDLASLGYGEIDRNRIASRCLDAWIDLCRNYGNAGFEQYRRDWSQFDAYAGQEVVVSRFGDKFTGKIQGVTNIGALIVREHNGTNHLLSDAEASIRLA